MIDHTSTRIRHAQPLEDVNLARFGCAEDKCIVAIDDASPDLLQIGKVLLDIEHDLGVASAGREGADTVDDQRIGTLAHGRIVEMVGCTELDEGNVAAL